MSDGLVLVVVLVAAVAVAAWGYHAKKKRLQGLAFVARQLGMNYSEDDVHGCLRYPFALLQRGDGRGTENVIWGTWQGMEVVEFDYWFYEETTDSKGNRSKSYSRFSCAVTEVDVGLSPLSIGRENVLTRLADAVGLDDIGFESEEFNREFNVKSKDRKFANDLIDQRMMAWLLATGADFSFETCGRWLLCYSGRRRPAELIRLFGTLKAFRDQVPRVVYDLYRVGPRPDPLQPPTLAPDVPPAPDGRH